MKTFNEIYETTLDDVRKSIEVDCFLGGDSIVNINYKSEVTGFETFFFCSDDEGSISDFVNAQAARICKKVTTYKFISQYMIDISKGLEDKFEVLTIDNLKTLVEDL